MDADACCSSWKWKVSSGEFKETDFPILAQQAEEITLFNGESIARTHQMILGIKESESCGYWKVHPIVFLNYLNFANIIESKMSFLEQHQNVNLLVQYLLSDIIRHLTY